MDTDATEPHWYLVQCKPREDQRALENLERQGFQCYLPMHAVERLRAGVLRKVREPLFPGYLFIRLDCVKDNWHPIRSTRGVIGIVRFREYPAPVPDALIEDIQRRLDSQAAAAHFKPGDRVMITQGSFANLEAIFVARDGDARVTLLLNILQSDQTVSFPLAAVRRV